MSTRGNGQSEPQRANVEPTTTPVLEGPPPAEDLVEASGGDAIKSPADLLPDDLFAPDAQPGGATAIPHRAEAGHQRHAAATPSSVRFGIAGLMRWSERLVEGMVTAYERMFSLGEEDKADIYMNLGADFAKKGNTAHAEEALRRTISLQPDNAMAWFHLGLVHLQQDESSEALGAFERAQDRGYDSFELHFYMAEALEDLERYEEQTVSLYKALEKQPQAAEAAFRLGVALDHLGRFEEAAAAFQIAIAHGPREVRYYQSLGFTLESLGRRDEAITWFKRALALERRSSRYAG